jgi:hypothetical protein
VADLEIGEFDLNWSFSVIFDKSLFFRILIDFETKIIFAGVSYSKSKVLKEFFISII